MVFAANYEACHFETFTMEDVGWRCHQRDTSRPLAYARWSPDSDAIMTTSTAKERLYITSMRYSKTFRHIKNLKHKEKGYVSSPDSKWFACLRRQDAKDVIAVYVTESFELIKLFEIDTIDAQDIVLSPNGMFIAVFDVALYYKLVVYRPDGTLETTFSTEDAGLGIKNVTWSPTSQFLAIGGYDHQLRLVDTLTWKQVGAFTHHTKYADIPTQELHVERELMSEAPCSGYDILNGIRHIPMLRPDHDKPNPKTAISAKFNGSGKLMLTLSESIPTTACIWDVASMKSHAIIVQQEPILAAYWNPKVSSMLAIFCEGGRAYIWQDELDSTNRSSVISINVPANNFSIKTIRWCPDGKSLMFLGDEMFCLMYCNALPAETDRK